MQFIATLLKPILSKKYIFPFILTVILILLTVFKIHGSSIGVYHEFFYGNTKTDSNLILNKPRAIRSDEWLTNTQMTIAQYNAGNPRINESIGEGQDMTVILDVPSKDWSTIFKPHNWSFFVFPLEYAFAFKWWIMAYLLILSCYFFIIKIMPDKLLVASLISLLLFLSAFIQWWYQYITVAPLYYSFLIILVYLSLLKENSKKVTIVKTLTMAYLLSSFALVLYPPFQIPVAIVMAGFILGYSYKGIISKESRTLKAIASSLVAVLLCGLIILTFIQTRSDVIDTVRNTAYPGKRVVTSGGFDVLHLPSGFLAYQFQHTDKAEQYSIPKNGIYNQSETANFIPISALLFVPLIIKIVQDRKRRKIPESIKYASIGVYAVLGIFIIRMYVPGLDSLFKLLFLDIVPHKRLIIGIGLLNILSLVLFVKILTTNKIPKFSNRFINRYTLISAIILFGLALANYERFPLFISSARSITLAVPVVVFLWLILKNKIVAGLFVLVVFTGLSSIKIHPLYRGLDVITESKISNSVNLLGENSNEIWASEGIVSENIALLNNEKSITGLYSYPQLNIWQSVGGENSADYNRYAHAVFLFDREESIEITTDLKLIGGDNFTITTEPCSQFIQEKEIKFLIVSAPLINNGCIELIENVSYPTFSSYIYKLNY